MVCPRCGFDNIAGAKYCGNCGAKLSTPCPNCGFENPFDMKFCINCGTRLSAEARTGSALAPSTEFTPSVVEGPDEGLRTSPAAAPPAPMPTEERRLVTIIFADMVDFTAISEKLDPEEIRAIMTTYFEGLSGEIARYEGTVEKFIGDAVMAVFGAPVAHEDDPERAVRAAIEMQRVVRRLSADLERRRGITLRLRIGIHTGIVAAGIAEVDDRPTYTVTGDAVNTAARLEQAAESGKILVSESTCRATRSVIEYRELPPSVVRGKKRPLRVWEAVRVKDRRGMRRGIPGLEARLIDRDEEFALLKSLFHWTAEENAPHLVTVMSEAGVGKTRLAWEFEKYLDGLPQKTNCFVGRSMPYSTGVALWALREIIEAACHIREGEKLGKMRSKLLAEATRVVGVGHEGEDPSVVAHDIAERLGFLIGVSFPDGSLTECGPECLKEEVFWGLRRFFEGEAGLQPTVLVFEDFQWAEDSLLDFIEYLADRAKDVPLFILCLTRPELLERRPTWGGGKRNYSSLMLEPLTREHSRELIEELLAVPDLPEEIKDLILNRSEGNSFFLEEIIRMFIDEGVLWRDDGRWRARPGIRDLRVPDTVQGLIAARIDRLPPDEKQVVQAASVIGRAFWRGAVTHLVEGPLKKNVAANLQGVLSKDLVIEWETSHFAGEREYAFKHGLIREVAYEALPKARRGLKHRQVAEWMEKAAGDRSDEYVELLAYHYEQAAKLEDAAEPLSKGEVEVLKRKAGYYLGRAGAKAADREAFRTAGDLYQRAMAFIAEPGPRTKAVEAKTYIELLCGYAEVLDRLGEFERAAQQLHKAIELADAREEKRMAAMARRQLGEVCRDRSDMAGARRWLEEASILAHEVGDKHIEADSLRLLGTVAFMTNNYPEAEESLHRALALFQELGGRSHDGGVMQNLSAMYLKQGQYDEAERWAKAAIERAHEVRNKRAEAWALDLLSDLQSGRGDIKEAMASAQHGLDLFREISDKRGEASTLQSLGNLYREGGRWVEAEQVLHEAMSLSEEMGNPLHIGSLWLSLGWLNLYRGDFAEAERFVKDNLLGHAERLGELRTITIATGQVLLSWVYAYQGRHAEAAEAGDAAVKDLERSGSRDALRSAYLGAALGYLGQGQPDRAMERVQSQMRIIAELDVGQQGTARRVLAMVQAARGEDGAADESFRHSIDLLLGKGFEANLMLCYLEYGKFLRQRGRMPESRDVLNRARRICQEIGASFWLAEIERLSG